MKRWISWSCHHCRVHEGQLHHYDCDVERCPFCGGQLVGCGCCYKKLGIDCSKGTWAYRHGLTVEQSQQWRNMLEEKGRIPYLLVPGMCRLCGYQWPKMFAVADKTWRKYVLPELRKEMLCEDCFRALKRLFPKGWRAVGKEVEGSS